MLIPLCTQHTCHHQLPSTPNMPLSLSSPPSLAVLPSSVSQKTSNSSPLPLLPHCPSRTQPPLHLQIPVLLSLVPMKTKTLSRWSIQQSSNSQSSHRHAWQVLGPALMHSHVTYSGKDSDMHIVYMHLPTCLKAQHAAGDSSKPGNQKRSMHRTSSCLNL